MDYILRRLKELMVVDVINCFIFIVVCIRFNKIMIFRIDIEICLLWIFYLFIFLLNGFLEYIKN